MSMKFTKCIVLRFVKWLVLCFHINSNLLFNLILFIYECHFMLLFCLWILYIQLNNKMYKKNTCGNKRSLLNEFKFVITCSILLISSSYVLINTASVFVCCLNSTFNSKNTDQEYWPKDALLMDYSSGNYSLYFISIQYNKLLCFCYKI